MIAYHLSNFLLSNGATIEPVVTENQIGPTPNYLFNTGVTASGLEAELNCHVCDIVTMDAVAFDMTDSVKALKYLLTSVINARIQATLVLPEHVMRQVAKLDSIDQDGNSIKVRFANGVNPMNHVIKIGDEVYGVTLVKALATRHRLLLDRPLRGRFDKATPIFGCEVPERTGTDFKGVTVISNAFDDGDAEGNQHQCENGLHVRIMHRFVGTKSQYAIESICGLVVDGNIATLRGKK